VAEAAPCSKGMQHSDKAGGSGGFLRRMRIGAKLNLGFGVLVLLTMVVIALSIFASRRATENMSRSADLRAPTALASEEAQANLLRMLADVRGYLALGDRAYRESYDAARVAFEANLEHLEALATGNGTAAADAVVRVEFRERLEALKAAFQEWSRQPQILFRLHDDQLAREPGLQLLIKEGNRPIAIIVTTFKKIIEAQRRREPTAGNMALLTDISQFQASFLSMIAGLRGYVTTGRENFKFEYNSNLAINERALRRLQGKKDALSASQQGLLEKVTTVRESFVPLPEQIFEWVEGEKRRMDLYLFRRDAVPPAEQMLALLSEITLDQQNLLQGDLDEGRNQLEGAQRQIVATGIIAFVLAITLAYLFRANIVGPVRRLTGVAQRVGSGDIEARAKVESGDEIGTLARRFNEMNEKLGQTLSDLDERRKQQESTAITLKRQNEYMGALHDTTLGLMSRLNLTELLADLVARAGQLLDTPHGYIYLVEGGGGTLERRIGIGAYAKSIGYNLKPDQGLAGKVWQSGEPLVVNDYGTWEGSVVDATYEVNIRALTGVPLKSGAEVIGVLGMAYDVESDKSFGEDEVELLSRFAQLASISLDNARLYTAAQDAMERTEEASKRVTEQNRMLESISSQLSKYLSPQLYASIFSGEQSVEIASQRKKLTVFFSDIVDFTETTDSLESEELTQLLNRHLTEMSQIALEHGATIDKYVGDSIMVFFGDPESKGVKEDAVACVRMAIAMQRRMRELQSEWLDLGSEKPFQLRIGINTGYCTVGNFGSEERMDYTIIGNEVNLAARLQSHAEVGGVLIAHETYALVKDLVHAEEQEPIVVKGFAKPVRTYRVAGIYGELADEGRLIHHDQEALKILVDLDKLSDQDRAEAIQTVENILAKMKK
jgi:class 3 adenylate cyclase/CHASE3 domain sensor protein